MLYDGKIKEGLFLVPTVPCGCTLVAADNFVILLYCPPMGTNTYFIHKRNKKKSPGELKARAKVSTHRGGPLLRGSVWNFFTLRNCCEFEDKGAVLMYLEFFLEAVL